MLGLLLLLLQAGLLQNLHAMQALQHGMQIADNSIDQPQPGKVRFTPSEWVVGRLCSYFGCYLIPGKKNCHRILIGCFW